MSSLLDILHKRQEPAEPAAPPPPAAEDPPTLELRLAVDNAVDAVEIAEAWTAVATEQDLQASGPAAEPIPAAYTAPVPPVPSPPPAPTASAMAATAAPEPAARVPEAGRARRSTRVLAGGLAAIVVAALAAAWLLRDAMTDEQDSMFTAGPPAAAGTGSADAATGGGTVVRPEPRVPAEAGQADLGAEPATAPATQATGGSGADAPAAVAPAPDELLGPAPAWYDAPAVEAPPPEAAAEAAPPVTIRISRGAPEQGQYPRLQEAWQAFRAGEYPRAEALYRDVLAADAANVDALLGVAALAARGGRLEEARSGYAEVLRVDPRNTAAVAALSTLPAAPAATRSESELKTLLRDQPDAGHLQFALGLRYVSQGRWSDAQGAFFEAVRSDPGNADYAFNLAVSLDQMGQKSTAATYYERALALATGPALFDRAAAETRLARLRAPAP